MGVRYEDAQAQAQAQWQGQQQYAAAAPQQGYDPSEVLIFRDYTGWEEPALLTPFGFWSLRNIIVLVIFGGISGLAYSTIVPDNMAIERDWMLVCAALAPLGLGVMFASMNTPFGSSDAIIVALIVLAIHNLTNESSESKTKKPKRQQGSRRKQKSKVLGIPQYIDKQKDAHQGDNVDSTPLEIVCADLDELKSIRVTIYGGDGYAYGNRMVSCHLDDELVDMMRTSPDGSLVLHVRPEQSGSRLLTVRSAESEDVVLLAKPLFFVRSGGDGMGSGSGRGADSSGAIVASVLDDNTEYDSEEDDTAEYDDDDENR